MNADPYNVLGVKKDASQDDIQKAYRKLAKKLHPDLNPGNKQAEEQFKAVSAAYDLLSDPEKRARFDRGEIDASGQERPRQRYYRDFAGGAAGDHPYASSEGFSDFSDEGDLFSSLFGRGGRMNLKMRGQDVHYRLPVEFLEAVNGATRRITLSDGSTVDVTVPPGARDGQLLRLAGKGGAGIGGGPPGDAFVEIVVKPHPLFTRKDDDIHLELPVSLTEAVLGGKISVPTPTGAVSMNVPKGSNTGTVLRLRGKGVARSNGTRGDEYVKLKVVLPEKPDPELEKFVQSWTAGKAHDPRRGMEAQMLHIPEFVLRLKVSQDVVETWVEEGWLRPQRTDQGLAFTEMDMSRAQMIRDLREDLGVNEEGIAIVLDLIDQMHGLRKTLRELCEAVGVQSPELQQRILADMRSRRPIPMKGPETP